MKYSLATTILKGAFGAAGGGIIGVLMQWIADGISTGNWGMSPDEQGVLITGIVAAATAGHVMIKNWWKNYAVPKIDGKGLGF